MRTDLQLHHDTSRHRYEARAGEDTLGYVEYRTEGDAIVFTHTVVQPEAEGQGVGGFLARGVLDAARAANRQVVPECSFIAAYLRRHPDDLALVRPETRRSFDLG
ncbi:MAG: GNAT family N-acetyltransferase [Pseudomonadota bacterium]